MASYLTQHWAPQFQGISRRDRGGCSYRAYLPDTLNDWKLTVPGDVAADLADAETAVQLLNHQAFGQPSFEGIARFLLRAESVGSSKIEGLSIGARRLARAEAALAMGGDAGDRLAAEILGNIAAMEAAIEVGDGPGNFSLKDLLSIHQTLMTESPNPKLGGLVRTQQNWIGGSSYNPCNATFVPPPAEELGTLLEDLVGYINSDSHSPLTQAALTHAQFETLHPFSDGNGRTGRALIHVVLRRRGLTPSFVPPLSLALAARSRDYIGGLTAFRYESHPSSVQRSEAAALWLETLASATTQACGYAAKFDRTLEHIRQSWRAKLGQVRTDSGTALLIGALAGSPIVTTESASVLIGRSKARTNDAIKRLLSVGVLAQRNVGRQRYRVFEASEILDLFTSIDTDLSTG